mgnify:CR=1 FL=1
MVVGLVITGFGMLVGNPKKEDDKKEDLTDSKKHANNKKDSGKQDD